jgi:aromatic-L-amino-acid decarboxylase
MVARKPTRLLRQAFSLVAEYLKTAEGDKVVNYMDYGIQLGRRFRALKLWMVIRYFGASGLAERMREHIRLAQELASWIDSDPDFERMAPTPLSLVCFRARAGGLNDEALDRLNEKLMETVNASGKAFLSHTKLRGRFVLRMAISNLRTTEGHVKDTWELIRDQAHRIARDSL